MDNLPTNPPQPSVQPPSKFRLFLSELGREMEKNSKLGLTVLALVVIAGTAGWMQYGKHISIGISKFFAASSVSVTCLPTSQVAAVGSPITLTAANGNGTYAWFAPQGTPATAAGTTFSVTYFTTGTKKVTVQSTRGDGSGSVDSVACTVNVGIAAQ